MRHLVAVATAGLLLSGAAMAGPQYSDRYGGSDALIRCESKGGGTERCEVEGGIADARLVRTLSNAPCLEGRTWGRERGFLWVAGGCRGEFSVRRGGMGGENGWSNDGRAFRCESRDNRYRECASDGRGRARLVRQLSDAPCIEGRTWGSSRGGVWVDRGCRAEFAAGRGQGWGNGGNRPGYGGPGYGDGYAQTVRCESTDNRQRECNVAVRNDVRLSRQLSDTRCVEGQNWGWSRRGIWVTRGCRAEFEVR